eukprot:gene8230-biopygen3115
MQPHIHGVLYSDHKMLNHGSFACTCTSCELCAMQQVPCCSVRHTLQIACICSQAYCMAACSTKRPRKWWAACILDSSLPWYAKCMVNQPTQSDLQGESDHAIDPATQTVANDPANGQGMTC